MEDFEAHKAQVLGVMAEVTGQTVEELERQFKAYKNDISMIMAAVWALAAQYSKEADTAPESMVTAAAWDLLESAIGRVDDPEDLYRLAMHDYDSMKDLVEVIKARMALVAAEPDGPAH